MGTNIPDERVDVLVIGAGIVGCAVASVLSRRRRSVGILEREPLAGTGISSRNSGVIHSGLYHPPASRKARTCIRGNRLLRDWALRRSVPHRIVGKLVIARTAAEHEALRALYDNARASGAEGIALVNAASVHAMEPDLPNVTAALSCEHSGIIDAHALVRSLLDDAEARGAWFAHSARVQSVGRGNEDFVVETSRGALRAAAVVNAAGLYADEIAHACGYDRYVVDPCRGDYFRLRTTSRYRHLVYPVRVPHDPGLGIHLTVELGGGYRLGPDAEYGVAKNDFSPAEHKLDNFLRAGRRLLGALEPKQLTYDGCGIRPKLRAVGEPIEHDFVVAEHPARCIHLLGIESPGLTAALALAEEVADRLCG